MTPEETGAALASQIRRADESGLNVAFATVNITRSAWDALGYADRVAWLGQQAVYAIEHADSIDRYPNDGDPED